MRGEDNKQEAMFSYVSPEKRVPTDHPLRPIRAMVDGILKEMSPQFAKRYADVGRPSIAPERLLRVLLLQIFYSVRSERLLMEQLQYNLLFRWFVGMEMDEEVWNHAVFSKNRERLLNEEIAEAFSSGCSSWPSRICRTSILRWTGRGSKRGRARRVFGGRTTRGTGRVRAARETITERSAATKPINPRPIPRRGDIRNRRARTPC